MSLYLLRIGIGRKGLSAVADPAAGLAGSFLSVSAAVAATISSSSWYSFWMISRIRWLPASGAKVKPVFPDAREEAIRFFKAHGFYPANHAYVIRGDINEKYPWLAFNLYKGFIEAKRVYQKNLAHSIPSGLIFGQHYLRETQKIFGEDPYPYGVQANRDYIQTCIDFSFEQGFIKSKPNSEDLYAAAVRDF